jgi:hypothetical protein
MSGEAVTRYRLWTYLVPPVDRLEHVWVHNGPLWRLCPSCRALRRTPMADGRGKQSSKNTPSTGTSADKRLRGNGGKKPGPKRGSKNKKS